MAERTEPPQPEKRDTFDGEYIGNPWGWRFSLFGLALILLLLAIMIYRHLSLGVPFNWQPEPEKQEVPVDSLPATKEEAK